MSYRAYAVVEADGRHENARCMQRVMRETQREEEKIRAMNVEAERHPASHKTSAV